LFRYTKLFAHQKASLGENFDKPNSRMVGDGSKGLLKAFKENFTKKQFSYCANHFGDNLATTCGAGAKREFLTAVAAVSMVDLAAAKALFKNAKLIEKLKNYPDAELFPAAFPDTTNITTSNHAESANAMCLKARKVNLIAALRCIMEMQQAYHIANVREAMRETDLVPKNLKKLKDYIDAERNAFYLSGRVYKTNANGTTANVIGATKDTHNVDLNAFTCDCRRWPHCAHLSAAAQALGHAIGEFYKPPFSTKHWKAQMRAVGDFPAVPSRAAVNNRHDLFDSKLRLPLTLKKKTGAPRKTSRRKGALERAGEKRTKTMSSSTVASRRGPS
jgi:hypothetical protein